MMNIEFITGGSFISHWHSGSAEYAPVYAMLNGKKRFVRNIIKSLSEVEDSKNNLMLHNGKYITFHAMYDNPFDFLNWVKENNYTLEVVREFFVEDEDFTDFHGNCCEYSCAFHYRIYDEAIIKKLKSIVSNMKKYIE